MQRDSHVDGVTESRALTGLRGLAALLVMVHHFYLRLAIDERLPMLQWMLRKGYLGVDLFFVVSGFVIAMVYGRWFDGSRRDWLIVYPRFVLRRVARLWPLHAFVVVVLVLAGWQTAHPPVTARMVAVNLAMVQAWGTSAEINAPAWSVSTEFLMYLIFPGIALLALRGRVTPWLCVLAVVAAFTTCMLLAPPLGPMRRGRLDIYYNYSILPELRCFAGFTVGVLCWRVGQIPLVRRVVSMPWVGPAALFAMIFMMLGRMNDLVIFTATMPLIVLGMHFGQGPVHRAFSRGPLHMLGVLSYATYLIHFALLGVFPFAWGPLRYMLPVYFVCTVAIAYVLHRLVEQPGRRVIRLVGEWVLLRLRWVRSGGPAVPPLHDEMR